MEEGVYMSNEVKVSLSYVTKQYDLYKRKSDKIKAFFKPKNTGPTFWALRGVSLEIMAGEAVGLIGTNGSGKSTLSNIIAGIIPPTTGQVILKGETSIIAIGAGLKQELTGLENIHLKSLMSGMANDEIEAVLEDIISFSDLGDFIHQPVKSYSSGMKSRLGFAIAVHMNPDIIIIDEALSVGDETFYQRCVDRIMEFKAQGKTIIFVSHSLNQVSMLCDKVAWIQNGELKQYGLTEEVLAEYKKFIKWFKSLKKGEQKQFLDKQKTNQKVFNISTYFEEVARTLSPSISEAEVKNVFYKNNISEGLGIGSTFLLGALVVTTLILGISHIQSLF